MGNCCASKLEEFEVFEQQNKALNQQLVLEQENASNFVSKRPSKLIEANKMFLERSTKLKSKLDLVNVLVFYIIR